MTSRFSKVGVTTDDFQGTKDAVKHLAELGHKHISYISHKSVAGNAEYIINREAGYTAGMKEFIGDSAEIKIEKSKTGIFTDKEVFKSILDVSAEKRPTAFICINDTIAMELMQTAYQLGIKIPEEISIIGFADLEMAKYAVVPLTTIAQPFEKMGKETAKMLLDIAQSKHKDRLSNIKNRKLKAKLVIRESTAAPENK